MHVQHFAARQLIVREGDPGDDLYIVESGSVLVTSRDVRLALLEWPAPIGDLGIFADRPRTATAIAETDCTLLRIATPDLMDALRLTPEVWEGVALWFAEFAYAKAMDEKVRTHNLRSQLARLLLSRADPATGAVSLTQIELAEILAVRRSTIQRHLDAFRVAGLITRSGRVAILDHQGLEREGLL
ncbi:Crp/Fnr family transcriptional regulator [Azospirillum cavernae]|uniref:Crp/Fnr family transcriptional regulator n=1 Tax=Azospirillum cavernae TaxID=2320860 RepID=UPI001314BA43|nr:cyclic nucleotide-binding domain-containing protein [Azospirillum cavernae]